jgi:hypothetical protein
VDRRCACELELEHGAIHYLRGRADGRLGMEEGEAVSQGVWRQVQAEEVCDSAGDLVGGESPGDEQLECRGKNGGHEGGMWGGCGKMLKDTVWRTHVGRKWLFNIPPDRRVDRRWRDTNIEWGREPAPYRPKEVYFRCPSCNMPNAKLSSSRYDRVKLSIAIVSCMHVRHDPAATSPELVLLNAGPCSTHAHAQGPVRRQTTTPSMSCDRCCLTARLP